MSKKSGIQHYYGCNDIVIAVLDTDVDINHPCFSRAKLEKVFLPNLTLPSSLNRLNHGTYVASQLFGHIDCPAKGIAPDCKGLIIPIYEQDENGLFCTQQNMAEAIHLAIDHGAHIINISGGELLPNDQSYLELKTAIKRCEDENVLVIAAAGNNGCYCEQIPAALPWVIAVGAADTSGDPFSFSNFGENYKSNGVLVSIEGRQGAVPGGTYLGKYSTSYATPVLAGYAARLLCEQVIMGAQPNPSTIRSSILSSLSVCDVAVKGDCKPYLAGYFTYEKGLEHLLSQNIERQDYYPLPNDCFCSEDDDLLKVKSLKIKKSTIINQRYYCKLEGKDWQIVKDWGMPAALAAEIAEKEKQGYSVFAIGAEEKSGQSNLRVYLGFSTPDREVKSNAFIGTAYGWNPSTLAVEVKDYTRLDQQTFLDALAEQGALEGSRQTYLEVIKTLLDKMVISHYLEVKNRETARLSWDIGGLSPSSFEVDFQAIFAFFEVDGHPELADWITAGAHCQNFAFGFDEEGDPFFTIYYPAATGDLSSMPATETIQNLHTIKNKMENNSIHQNLNLPSMNPQEMSVQGHELESQLVPSEINEAREETVERIEPSGCNCQSNTEAPAASTAAPKTASAGKGYVYVIGRLSIGFGSMPIKTAFEQYAGVNGEDGPAVAKYLRANPSEAETVQFVISVQNVPVYVIRPLGAYAAHAYQVLIEMYESQFTEKVERVAIPGINRGSSKLMSGQVVPVLSPSTRGMASWSTEALINAVSKGKGKSGSVIEQRLQDFLNRTYFELRNMGLSAQERALNYAASNAFQVGSIIQSAMDEQLELAGFNVVKSPISFEGEDTWDVQITFFNPKSRSEQAAKIYAFTVDVSTVTPYMIGEVRSWFKY
jgi:hypothetical protein